MYPYWLLFALFAGGVMLTRADPQAPYRNAVPLALAIGVATMMIGLRYEVGGDWGAYEFMFEFAERHSLQRVLRIGDPGYQFVNWFAAQYGDGVWPTNLFCAAVFGWGLFRLVRIQPDPWLAALVAVPYLIVVVAMGYTRQAVAIGIIMAGLASLERGGATLRFAAYAGVAALFHKTAVVVLPLVILAAPRNRTLTLIGGAAISLLLYDLILADAVQTFTNRYIRSGTQSQGAAIRVLMCAIPAALYLLRSHHFGYAEREQKIWRNISLTSLVLLLILPLSPSSTAIDRIALYLLPVQIAVLSRVPLVYGARELGRAAIVIYSGLVLFVWLNFAFHAEGWLPYQLWPFDRPA